MNRFLSAITEIRKEQERVRQQEEERQEEERRQQEMQLEYEMIESKCTVCIKYIYMCLFFRFPNKNEKQNAFKRS